MRRTMLAFTLIILAACRDSTTAPPPPVLDVTGTWNAVSVNGAPLPVTYGFTTVVERRLTLSGNTGTWHDETYTNLFRLVDYTISWTRAGNQVTVTGTGLTLTFIVRGNELVNITDGRTVIYRRQ